MKQQRIRKCGLLSSSNTQSGPNRTPFPRALQTQLAQATQITGGATQREQGRRTSAPVGFTPSSTTEFEKRKRKREAARAASAAVAEQSAATGVGSTAKPTKPPP